MVATANGVMCASAREGFDGKRPGALPVILPRACVQDPAILPPHRNGRFVVPFHSLDRGRVFDLRNKCKATRDGHTKHPESTPAIKLRFVAIRNTQEAYYEMASHPRSDTGS